MLRIWDTEADRAQICTDFPSPSSSGPTEVTPPRRLVSLVEMEAEWIAGITSTLASSVRRTKG